jgi:predicted nucleotidyltransferase
MPAADRPGAMSIALAQPQLDAIAAACRRHHVARLHAFGSLLRPDYRPGESDIDLLVEFQPLDASNLYKSYFALLNELRQGLASRVDLVMADAVRNPYIKQSIEASKQEIYAYPFRGRDAHRSNPPLIA